VIEYGPLLDALLCARRRVDAWSAEGGWMSGRWVDLREAAALLGTSTEAVRKRAARGSLRSDRQNGRVLVWVDESRTEGGREAQVDREELLEAKDETIRLLEEQLRLRGEEIQRRDVIISQLTQATSNLTDRLRELEAPPASQEGLQSREEAAHEPVEDARLQSRAGWHSPSERL
jgi:hypothetical protein